VVFAVLVRLPFALPRLTLASGGSVRCNTEAPMRTRGTSAAVRLAIRLLLGGVAVLPLHGQIGSCTNPNPNPNPNPASFASRSDFNGDCKSDILWRNSNSQQVYTWLMNGTSIVSQGPASSPSSAWVIQGTGDFDADGRSDILWRNSTTDEVYLWLMNGTSIASQASLGVIPSDWVIQGVGDFNGDGKADILWRNSTSGMVYLWMMNGTSIANQGNINAATSDWVIEGIGDFDGDGSADILWRNSTSGMVYLWMMNGTTIASQGSPTTVSADWVIQGVGDFNRDGRSDILWRNSNTGLVYIWMMNGASITGQGGVSNPSSDWVIKGVGDYNGDGMSDILWDNSGTGQVYIWLMNGASIMGDSSPGTPGTVWQIAQLPGIASATPADPPAISQVPQGDGSSETVTLSDDTSGAAIYYTTDGTTPSSASTKYTTSFTVSHSAIINAIAVAAGYGNSPVATGCLSVEGSADACTQLAGSTAVLDWGAAVNGTLTGSGVNAGGLGPASASAWPVSPGTVVNGSVGSVALTVTSNFELERADNAALVWSGAQWIPAYFVDPNLIFFGGDFGAATTPSSQPPTGDDLLGALASGPSSANPTMTLAFGSPLHYVGFQISSATEQNFTAVLTAYNSSHQSLGTYQIVSENEGGSCAGLSNASGPIACDWAPLIQFYNAAGQISSIQVTVDDASGFFIDELGVATGSP
jgi:hypothetical protein